MTFSPSLLGLDLGGTKTAVCRFDAQTMRCEQSDVSKTHAKRSFDHVLGDLLERIETVRTADTTAIGIGVPGLIDRSSGRVLTMPNIPGAEGIALAEILSQKTGVPVIAENDANCFAFAEAIVGAGKGESVVIGLTLGTGVGGGIVINGVLYHGSHGFAGEVGHMLLMPGHPPFESGNSRGDVEQFLSGSALRLRCSQAKTPGDLLSGDVCSFLHPDLYREMAWLIVSLTHLLDPSIIVLGGSAGRALAPHLQNIRSEMKNWLLPHVSPPQLAIGTLEHPGCLGAALLAKQKYE